MGTVEEVRIARRTGFCYGVREAIDYARLAAAQGKSTHTLGQVVHNEGVIAQLQSQGIQTVDTLDDVDSGAAVVIRAHGVTPEVMSRAESKGLDVIDGTCTWVIQEQKELRKLVDDGYTIVLLGTPHQIQNDMRLECVKESRNLEWSATDAPEVVEAPVVRPAIGRSGRTL